jgi:carbamoyl-phosphate synthase large subunit
MAQAARALKIFLRQPFTQSSKSDVARIQSVMDVIKRSDGKPYKLDFLTTPIAESEDSFKIAFETTQRKAFTPFNFRNHRLGLLKEADAFIIIKTSLSESTAFEVSYNIFGGRNVPMLFAIHESSFPIKTTLLRELDDLASHVEYVTFKNGEDLQAPIQSFLKRVAEIKSAKSSVSEKPSSSQRPPMLPV